MANSLILTDNGIKHISEIPEIEKNLEVKVPSGEREWVVQKIKSGHYCKWENMREKDKLYFKNWTEIDPVECALHNMSKKC